MGPVAEVGVERGREIVGLLGQQQNQPVDPVAPQRSRWRTRLEEIGSLRIQ